MAETEG